MKKILTNTALVVVGTFIALVGMVNIKGTVEHTSVVWWYSTWGSNIGNVFLILACLWLTFTAIVVGVYGWSALFEKEKPAKKTRKTRTKKK